MSTHFYRMSHALHATSIFLPIRHQATKGTIAPRPMKIIKNNEKYFNPFTADPIKALHFAIPV